MFKSLFCHQIVAGCMTYYLRVDRCKSFNGLLVFRAWDLELRVEAIHQNSSSIYCCSDVHIYLSLFLWGVGYSYVCLALHVHVWYNRFQRFIFAGVGSPEPVTGIFFWLRKCKHCYRGLKLRRLRPHPVDSMYVDISQACFLIQLASRSFEMICEYPGLLVSLVCVFLGSQISVLLSLVFQGTAADSMAQPCRIKFVGIPWYQTIYQNYPSGIFCTC